ncbi:hypothetical protein [Rothia nasimurium]|uniref:hypothetical protein n=1 Tax=Rothia nasimurium TaxID=85336 RepID=UPI001F385D0D|nr:hypothetical protein [Rothia nasimurium]
MIPDISWAQVQSCTCVTSVVAGKSVGSLISIREDPLGASLAWKAQKQPSSHMAEGLIAIESGKKNLFSDVENVELHDTWSKILTVIYQVLECGEGSAELGFQSKNFSLKMVTSGLVVTVDGIRHLASPDKFIESLIEGAENFYSWYETYIPGNIGSDLSRLKDIKLMSKL